MKICGKTEICVGCRLRALLNKHYDWFIDIEPDRGDYFIDRDRDVARQKAKQKYPAALSIVMCVNETGFVDSGHAEGLHGGRWHRDHVQRMFRSCRTECI